jgi:hypothetical protein
MNTVFSAPEKSAAGDNNAKIVGSFTMAVWARPDAAIALPSEANEGVFMDAARNDALYPPPGHEVYAPAEHHSGAGLSVGKNGVCVFEHGTAYFAPLLVYAAPITAWTHVAVVYRDGVPELYLNGKFVHKGKKSTFKVHPGVGVRHTRGVNEFRGELGEFRMEGRALAEGDIAGLMKEMPLPASRPQSAPLVLLRGGQGNIRAEVSQPGSYALKTAGGRTSQFEVGDLPAFSITGPWDVRFKANLGAPEHVKLGELISWSEHPDTGVRYYSGAATYAKTFTVPPEIVRKGRGAHLDLGRVEVMAEVRLNGKDLGILWKPPYIVDVTGVLRAGSNDLEVKVVNLWINRQIGDERLPEDSDRNPDGTLKAWPAWLGEGKPSPTGRHTFTSWRLWKKDDPLVESGLLGPVTLQTTEFVDVK